MFGLGRVYNAFQQQAHGPTAAAAGMNKADMTQQQENWRKVIHVDMDAFFASVEQHDHPELMGLPVAVGHADGRGVVAAASYEARRFGVHSAMPSARARQLCPELVFVESRMGRYREVSAQVHEIFSRYTDLIEPISIDEAFLDVTQNKPGISLAVDIAREIKASIKAELGLTASAGVSYNKLLAKIASDWRKPDGLCTIHPQAALKFIDQLKVEHLWGVGPATAKAMHEMGIETARQLRQVPLPDMMRRFGKAGVSYYNFVRGIDHRPVMAVRERKSVGCEHTYGRDMRSRDELKEALDRLIDELLERAGAKKFEGLTLTLKVRFFNFETVTRSRSAKEPWTDRVAIRIAAQGLLQQLEIPAGGVRLMGLSVSDPVGEHYRQARLKLEY